MALASTLMDLFATVGSHLPMWHLICQRIASFANVTSYLPKNHLICRCYILFAKESPHLPIQSLICQFQFSQLPIQLPHLPKAVKKIFLTPPKGYHNQEIASGRLHSINLDSLVFFFFFFFISPAHTLSKIGHRFTLGKWWLIFRQKISFCKISTLLTNECIFKVKLGVPLTSFFSKYGQKYNLIILLN